MEWLLYMAWTARLWKSLLQEAIKAKNIANLEKKPDTSRVITDIENYNN